MTQICVFNTRLFSLHNTLNYVIHRACLRIVLLTDVYRNLTSLWIKPRECAFKQFKSPVLNVLSWSKGNPEVHRMKRRIHICSDSRAAIAALAKTTSKLSLEWESTKALEKLIGSNEVTLVWIPGHHGTPGNEEADKLAKEGTNGVPSEQTVGIPFVVGK